MLNIGKLSPGGGEYYIGEIATSAEDYYTGHGEAAGRWVGTLAADLGLVGEVDPEHFRRVLLGQDPFTGETLLSAHAQRRTTATTAPIAPGRLLDVAQAASFLGVSAQYVRYLLKPGEEHRDRLASASPDERCLTRSCWWGSGTRPSGKRSKEGSRRLLQTGGAIAAALPVSPRR